MISSFHIKVVLVVFVECVALWLWKLNAWPTVTQVEHMMSVQLTGDEMLYVLGASSDNSTIMFDKYLQYVRSHILNPSKSRPRKLLQFTKATRELGKFIDTMLNRRRNGFFVECGAADGSHSQTQFVELNRNWTGLLVEANQRYFKELLKLNRQAFVFGGCLTPNRPKQVKFMAGGGHGLSDELKTEWFHKMLRSHANDGDTDDLVQCFSLEHLLASIGVNHVDFLSLDIQGGEPKILEAIDFNALRIDVILVEVEHGNADEKEILRNNMRALFNRTELYDEAATFDNDMVFQRRPDI